MCFYIYKNQSRSKFAISKANNFKPIFKSSVNLNIDSNNLDRAIEKQQVIADLLEKSIMLL